MKIQIIIAATKEGWMPADPVYLPLQVGAAGKTAIGYQRDDEGDNISAKNPNYCELTGLYWAWKHVDADYIGLCHYRRYFGRRVHTSDVEKKKAAIYTGADYERLLRQYDAILPVKRNYYIETVRSQYEHAHYKKDLDLVERIIREDYRDYAPAFTRVMGRRRLHLYNMFVMRKDLVDRYCTWLFSILAKAEQEIDVSNYSSYEARVYGFLAERLFNVWLEKEQLHTVEVPVVFLGSINWGKKIADFLKRKFISKQSKK